MKRRIASIILAAAMAATTLTAFAADEDTTAETALAPEVVTEQAVQADEPENVTETAAPEEASEEVNETEKAESTAQTTVSAEEPSVIDAAEAPAPNENPDMTSETIDLGLMADTVSYPIEKDQTYSFTNIGTVSYDITGLSSYIDYVIYYKDGSVSSYNWNQEPSTLSVPSGGKAVITSTSGTINAVVADEYFLIEEESNPAMNKVTAGVYETYTYTNTSSVAYNLLSDGYRYDYVLYDADGNVSDYEYGEYRDSLEIPAGYSIKVTPTVYTTTFNGIYEKFSVAKNDTPAMKKVVVSVGETYTYTNTSNTAYNLLSDGYRYDYVLYYSNDAVKETVSKSSSSSVSIPAGGKIKVTPTAYTTTFNGIYEIFDVTSNTTLEDYQTLSSDKTYIVTSTDTVDNTLQFKTTSTSDYAIYAADGALSEYKTRSSDDITIPTGGKAIITPNSLTLDSFIKSDTVSVAERDNPVYNTTYMNPGDTYIYTNTGSRELSVFKNGLSCDYVIYNADNSISSYGVNSTSESFTIPINGSVYITAHDYINVKGLYDYFTVSKADKEVFNTISCTLGDTYAFTNNAVKDINLLLSSGRFDYVIYNADSAVSSVVMNSDDTEITVPSGSKCVITPLVSNLSVHALDAAFAASQRSYPVLKRASAYFGETLTMTNLAAEDRTLKTQTGTYIDYVTYDAGNNPQEAEELANPSSITVPANGRAEIKVRTSNITVGGLYEAFSDEDFSVSVTGVELSKSYLELEKGKQSVLSATVLPTDATNKNVTWTSSDTDIVTVAQTGKVTAKAVGTATVTVTTADGGYSASCTVTVTGSTEPKDYPYEIKSLSLVSESGEALSSAPTGKSFIVNAELIENTARASEDYLIVAVYGTDGALLSLNYMCSDFVTGQAYKIGQHIPAQSKQIGAIKAFVWSSFSDMEPLAESKEL